MFHIRNQQFCAAALLIEQYLKQKGNFYQWSYKIIQEIDSTICKAVTAEQIIKKVGLLSRVKSLDKGLSNHRNCQFLCDRQCLLAYEAGVLSEDPRLHNSLLATLNSLVSGDDFYKNFANTILNFIDSVMDDLTVKERNDLAHCCLSTWLSSTGSDLSVQEEIMQKVNALFVVLEENE